MERGGVNFEKLKSLREVFFIIWGASPYGRAVIMVTKGGHNSGQNNYHTITFFFQEKVTFMVTFKKKNFLIFTSLVLKGPM